MNKNLGTAFGSYIEPSGDEAIELCKDSGLSAKPVGYVYQETDSFTGHKHLVGAIDKQTLAVGTPLYAHPPTPTKPLNDFDELQAAAKLGLDAFDKMIKNKLEFVEQAIAALRQALK